jgi:nitrate ABC transporter ATP-binding subunit
MSLEFRGVWKGFVSGDGPRSEGPHFALRNVDLTIDPGTFVSLIGHSGCGKSTLLNIAGGLLEADAGEVLLDGRPVTGPGPERAMVFQNYSLLPRLDLFHNVAVAVRAARPKQKRSAIDVQVERYLTAVGLWEHRTKRPHQVSGGMQQRAAVARAFAVEPRVLLLDEPFGALDALTRTALQAELIDLWTSESETEIVMMVTHGIDEAAFLSDRIVVLGNPPGESVREVIDVAVPRPRALSLLGDHPRIQQVQDELMNLLRDGHSSLAGVV